MFFSLIYIHFYEEEIERAAGFLPPYPQPERRDDLFLILGERHQPLDPIPAVHPQWLSIPERGLYTGTLAVGAIGSGKTRGLILPAMQQLFGYRPSDAEEKFPASFWRSKAIFAVTCRASCESAVERPTTSMSALNPTSVTTP
jgi:hypothetical protein